jgi:biotin carboxyl carrier protein
MNIRVKVGETYFNVEVGDLQARPIVAMVDGERFEVWPEASHSPGNLTAATSTISLPTQSASPPHNGRPTTVHAPIPGVIVSIAVGAGAEVKTGDELCVLEAMKMKNSIRAARAGRVGAVHVAVGQTVKHKDVLIEYLD